MSKDESASPPPDEPEQSGTAEEPTVTAERVNELVQALPDGAKPDLAAALVEGISTREQQQAVFGRVVNALPDEGKPDLAAVLINGMDTEEQKKAAAGRAVEALEPEQRQQLARTVLGQPDPKTTQVLWYMVVSTLAATVFVFGVLAFVLIEQKNSAEAPLALATTALGGVVGLVATSPGSNPSN
ncbi:hypothetical protein [Streptomyces lucensis]|uniref:hypothetical protein n=1 Tax=Streptomyces lucensis TaxID=67319 RepID=UPI00167737C0|nr:hypothetical protein [Streptomyces lucensis]